MFPNCHIFFAVFFLEKNCDNLRSWTVLPDKGWSRLKMASLFFVHSIEILIAKNLGQGVQTAESRNLWSISCQYSDYLAN